MREMAMMREAEVGAATKVTRRVVRTWVAVGRTGWLSAAEASEAIMAVKSSKRGGVGEESMAAWIIDSAWCFRTSRGRAKVQRSDTEGQTWVGGRPPRLLPRASSRTARR